MNMRRSSPRPVASAKALKRLYARSLRLDPSLVSSLPRKRLQSRSSLPCGHPQAATATATDAPESGVGSDNFQLSLPANGHGPAKSVQLIAQARHPVGPAVASYISAALADNTRRAYQGDLADFLRFGGSVPCSPEMLAEYIAVRAESLSPHTITRRVVGISRAHTSQGLSDPAKTDLVRTLLRGVRRTRAVKQRQVSPLLKPDLLSILSLMKGSKGVRDRAMTLLGFAAALRRSELVALDVRDLAFVKEGVIVHLRQSKTDQTGEGRKIAVPFGRSSACPVRALEEWLQHSGTAEGAIFRSVKKDGSVRDNRLTAQSVALILKGYVLRAGLDAASFSGHSLRSGLVTSAAQAGVAAHKIQAQTGRRSTAMLARYIRDADIFVDNAAGAVL